MTEHVVSEKFTHQYRNVIRRNWWVYKKFLFSRFIWNLFAPTVTLIAFGIGLGTFLPNGIDGLPYLTFIAPGLIAYTTCFVSSGDTTYGTFVRFDFQKTFDAQVSTPIGVRDLVLGEILYATLASEIACVGMMLVVFLLHAYESPFFLLTPFIVFFGSLTFASQGILFTSFLTKIENFSYYFEGFLIPVQFLSGAFFPIAIFPAPLLIVSYLVPLTWVVNASRNAFIGVFDPVQIAITIAYCLFVSFIAFCIAYKQFYKRMMN